VLVPMIITEELGMIVCPLDAVELTGCSPLGPEEDVLVLGRNVKVWPIVVNVVGCVTDGTVIVLVPIIITDELKMIVCPSDAVEVIGCSILGLEEVVVGRNVKVCPMVVKVVG